MKQQLTFKQYRGMDLAIFTMLLCVCEALITLGATRWFPGEPYTLSLTPAVTAIVMVRWGAFAAIPAAAGALVFCVLSGAAFPQYAIYCVGNLAALALTQFIYPQGWKRLHAQPLLLLLYGVLAAGLMQLGRFVIAIMVGYGVGASTGFFTTDALSAVFAALLVWIARRLDGMLEEQKHYLRRVAEEMEKERQARIGDPWQR